ncbi:hypothetical protein LCGC14_2575340, partial [marine sediment metagenome]
FGEIHVVIILEGVFPNLFLADES